VLIPLINRSAARALRRAPAQHLVTAMAAVLGIAALFAVGMWFTRERPADEGEPLTTESAPATEAAVVALSPEKMVALHLAVQPAEYRTIQPEHRVPGRVGYNASRRLEVKMPVEGVVTQVLVRPGQAVKQGDTLAILSSVEVGLARDGLVNSEAEAALARRDRDWAVEVAQNLELLEERLQGKPSIADIESEFRGRRLGDHRDKVLSAYSKMLLAEATLKASESLGASGALAEITLRQRRSEKEIAAANFAGICEQSRFDAAQRSAAAQAKLDHAERLIAVNHEKLRLQLGPFAELSDRPTVGAPCEVVLRAAIDGSVEERLVAEGAHFAAAQTLFVLANTETLWVSAQLFERDWASFREKNVQEVLVECPAVPEHVQRAKTLFVSVVASSESRAVPLVAELENTDGRFKPGMFAWVTVPFGEAREALVVPASAITRREEQTLVFVEESPGTYRKVEVTLGVSTPEWVEITSGLANGQRVVTQGAFALKSELILRSERE
jgi:cobalt-zinc-cadmium efflux system membrane fusion protein